jgi:hypothetical protein
LAPRGDTADRAGPSVVRDFARAAASHDEVAHSLVRNDSDEQLVDQLAVAGGPFKLLASHVLAGELVQQCVLRSLDVLKELLP